MLALLLLATTIQLLVWTRVFSRAFSSSKQLPDQLLPSLPVSVIVCFHNEAANLEACLRAVLSQQPAAAEVIAVDDHSTDTSAAIVRDLQREFPRLRLVDPGPTRAGKKDALTAGLAAASSPNILLTDADCIPATPQWLSRMTSPLAAGAELVLGCSPYRFRPGLLGWWQRFETTYVALQYQGFARIGMPYMGVGRNLAYHKRFFQRAGGLSSHADRPGGDDDLLVNHHASPSATDRVTDPAAWTYSAPTPTWRDYLRQKLRHQSAGPLYRGSHQMLLVTLAASHGLFYLTGFWLLFTPLWGWAFLAYVLRATVVLWVFHRRPVRDFLGGNAGAGPVLLGDALLAPYFLFLAAATAVPPGRW